MPNEQTYPWRILVELRRKGEASEYDILELKTIIWVRYENVQGWWYRKRRGDDVSIRVTARYY